MRKTDDELVLEAVVALEAAGQTVDGNAIHRALKGELSAGRVYVALDWLRTQGAISVERLPAEEEKLRLSIKTVKKEGTTT